MEINDLKIEELEKQSSLEDAQRNIYRFLAPLLAAPRDSILRSEDAARRTDPARVP